MKTKQFLLAERDVHYLDEQYRAPIESLRREYQKRLASRIAAARGCPPSPLIQKLCASLVSVLNNLPLGCQRIWSTAVRAWLYATL